MVLKSRIVLHAGSTSVALLELIISFCGRIEIDHSCVALVCRAGAAAGCRGALLARVYNSVGKHCTIHESDRHGNKLAYSGLTH